MSYISYGYKIKFFGSFYYFHGSKLESMLR